ncbi:hypothetical protein G6F63_008289 [Rhizopus arrhizus]|nr:hypothetical protein G6F35_003342 [Rhizopus arrhizus]KAG1291234.1 hypothetical protein G6F66_007987 [Rhizopus arrhizus]KAG1340091.1 hypothetical protein G6F63_008289 [Rhizopus arrhizus]KAG1419227.1 hypothetical protein G6F59_007861 [Rhizopus arrhizus]
MRPINITLFSATGLAKQAISPILHLAQSSSVLLITETWLLPPNKYRTHWKQFHTYGIKTQPLATKGHQGISLLINPICPYHVHHLPNDNTSVSQYKLSFISADTLVHCVYLPPSLNNQVVNQVLDSLPRTAPNVKYTILCGDFNARMGSYIGDSSTNPRDNMIYRWLQENSFILWNQRLAYGKPTFKAHQGSSIIDFFMSDTELCNPSLTIWKYLSLDSAHKMISFSFHPSILPEVHSQQPRITWRLTKLQEAKTRNQYIQSFQNAANNISISIENNNLQPQDQQSARDFIVKLNDDICQAIYMSLDSICGRICQQTDPLKDFWTAEMRQAYEAREYYYRKWRKSYGLNKLHFWLQHQQARATLRRLIHQRRRENWRRFCHQMAIGEYTKAISKLSRIRKHRTLRPAFSTPHGPQHAADIMVSHLENVFSGQLIREFQRNNIYNPILSFEIECPIIAEDIQEAIRNLPTKKAPGVDHLRNEMLRPIQHPLTPLLLSLFRLCWMWSYTPQSWRVAQVVPIYKKGSTDEPSNYRPISLTVVFTHVIK